MPGTHKVDVIMGGPGREAAVSRESGKAIAAALEANGYDIQVIDVTSTLRLHMLREHAIAINIIHGTYGEDGTLQRILEAKNVHFMGSGSAASMLCMDKHKAKEHLKHMGDLPVPWGIAINPQQFTGLSSTDTNGPFVVKPRSDGSSVGLRMVDDRADVPAAVDSIIKEVGNIPLIIEEQLTGPEYTVAVIDDGGGRYRALPPLQITPASGTYDYEAKYRNADTKYESLSDYSLVELLQSIAINAFGICDCRDLARVDFRMNAHGDVHILEINTLPGFTNHSLVPMAAQLEGLSMVDLVDHLVSIVCKRAGLLTDIADMDFDFPA